ncbi:MAG: hypothetical protein M3442_07580 [Chloroflexota bacterium]|nr:hypothetical protein [Chloroflexota bacterium]
MCGGHERGARIAQAPGSRSDLIVFDTSCLAYFSDTGSAGLLLERYGGRAIVPVEVEAEFRRGMEVRGREDRRALLEARWWRSHRIELIEDLALFDQLIRRWGKLERNRGEAAALVAARRLGGVAVVDDRQARIAATDLGIPKTGTVGILVRLAVEGRLTIGEAAELHRRMVQLGFRSPVATASLFTALVERALET